MIDYINGKVVQKSLGYVIVDCNNIGYKLLVSHNTSYELKIDNTEMIYTYLIVKEDAMSLMGFSNIEERDMFEILIGVSKIGAKTALSILSIYRPSEIAEFIKSKDIVSLSKVSGLGKKTAERLILELKDKVDAFVSYEKIDIIEKSEKSTDKNIVLEEAIEALSMLGFTIKEAQIATKKAYDEKKADNVEDIIKMALSILKK